MGVWHKRMMGKDQDLSGKELAAALDWQVAAGIDLAVEEMPVDQFARQRAAHSKPQAAASAPTAAPPPVVTAGAPPPDGDPAEARRLAEAAPDLEALRAAMAGFEGCALKARATQLVFADGNPDAEIMLVGEAPGREEDLQGKPFVGRSGQLLDRMLAAIGLDRSKVFIVNTVPWRPPGNRAPTPAETQTCLPFLYRQIDLVHPKIIVSLGAPAAATLTGGPVAITKIRGQWRTIEIGGAPYRLLPTFHPAFLLRQPAQKAQAWRDLTSLKQALATDG